MLKLIVVRSVLKLGNHIEKTGRLMTLKINAVKANTYQLACRVHFFRQVRLALFICSGYVLSSLPVHAQETKAEQGLTEVKADQSLTEANAEKGWTIEANDQSLEKSNNTEAETTAPDIQIRESDLNALGVVSSDTSTDVSLNPSYLDVYDVSEGAEPIVAPVFNVNPQIDISDEQRQSLEAQFAQIQTLKETEDAFSEQLGESYLSYGRILMQVGRTDEARKMLVNALHVAKINNGVNAIEQRPILRELFELNFALGNSQDAEENLRRIVWLEKKIPNNRDFYSFDLFTRLGSFYLDLYLSDPVINQLSLDRLNKAITYLSYTLNRYGDFPLSQVLLPFGELAHAHHLKDQIEGQVNRSYYQNTSQRGRYDLDRSKVPAGSRVSSFARSEGYLKKYLFKAKEEKDLVNTIHALLGLGDINLLNDRALIAHNHYELAWDAAQYLPVDHPIVVGFDSPHRLPAFNPSVIRQKIEPRRRQALIPLSVNIDAAGYVTRVSKDALIEVSNSRTNRARRIAKRARFRPIIENGKLLAVNDHTHDVRLSVSSVKPSVAPEPKNAVSADVEE